MEHRNVKHLAGLLFTTGIAAVATVYPASVVSNLVGGLSVNLASSLLEKLGFQRFKSLIKPAHPNTMNHDLQSAFKAAVLMAIDNIQTLYFDAVENESLQKNAAGFSATLKDAIRQTVDPFDGAITEADLRLTAAEASGESLNQLLAALNVDLSDYKLDPKHRELFEKQIIPQIQLCFGEILKDNSEKGQKAWIAWQKWMGEKLQTDLNDGLRRLEEKIDRSSENAVVAELRKLDVEKIKQLKSLTETLQQPLQLEQKFKTALDDSLDEIQGKLNALLLITGDTRKKVTRQGQVLGDIHSDVKKISDFRWLYALLGVCLLAVAATWYYYQNQPFSVTVAVHGVHGKGDLVLKNRGKVTLRLGSENRTAVINPNGEAVFQQIPARYKNKPALVSVPAVDGDAYQTLNGDSVMLTPDETVFLAIHLTGLKTLSGVVKNGKTGNYLEGVLVQINNDLSATTNALGQFSISIPLKKQKRFQSVSFYKKGFVAREFSEVAIVKNQQISVMLHPAK